MATEKRNLDLHMRFWSILGPFMTLLIFTIYLVRLAPTHLYLPLAALIGLVLCWQWKLKGLFISLFLLLGFLLITFTSVPLSEKFWVLGMTMATALAFVVTSLSFEEIESLLGDSELESLKRSEHLARTVEKLKVQEVSVKKENEQLAVDLEWIKDKQKESENRILALQEDLEQAKQRENAYYQEARKLESSLQEAIENTKKQVTGLQRREDNGNAEGKDSFVEQKEPMSEYEALYKQLRQQFSDKSKILDETRRELFLTKEKLTLLEKEQENRSKYDEDECNAQLARDFIAVSSELARVEKAYREEIESLQLLVGELLTVSESVELVSNPN